MLVASNTMLKQKLVIILINLIIISEFANYVSNSFLTLNRFKRESDNKENLIDFPCGQRLENISQPFIVNGRNAKYGEFPWHVGIYMKSKNDPNSSFTYICGGSIISETSVLTVAHCFTAYDGTKIEGNVYSIAAGKYYNDYMSSSDSLSQKREVVDIEIHPQYKGINSNFAWDIALALIDKPFLISDVVQPICIDIQTQFEDAQLINDNYGYVAGWGFTEKNIKDPNLFSPSEELKVLGVPFIEREKCLSVLPKDFIKNVTPDKFCAGYTNGSSVCIGDSGSGLVFPIKIQKQTLYFLRGLVSAGVQKDATCDNFKYSTYTKISSHLSFFQDYVQNSCYTPNKEVARCIPFQKCQSFTDVIANKTITPEIYNFITESVCGNNNDLSFVCCGKSVQYQTRKFHSPIYIKKGKFEHENLKLLPSNDCCGKQDFQYNSLGSFITGLDEFPWTVRLEFKPDTPYDAACAGVLISDRYVLSTARCVAGFNGWNNRTLLHLRLGEYDLNTDLDCVNTTDVNGKKKEICADPYVDAKVEKIIPHPQFRTPYADILQNDIALVRLADKINFTRYIRPICLPLHGEATRIGKNFILSDWPWFFYTELPTNYSKLLTRVKQKVNVPVLNFFKCLQNYPYTEESNKEVSPSQICGGGLDGVDVCGSTGGPLMNIKPNTTQYYIEGLVSFGRLCGVEGVPSVYTRVSAFLKWILDNMEA